MTPGTATALAMSITATVENDTIKLPEGIHLPDGTQVTVEPVEGTPMPSSMNASRI